MVCVYQFSKNSRHRDDHACMNQSGAGCSEGAPDHEQSACASRHRSAKREIANGVAELLCLCPMLSVTGIVSNGLLYIRS